MGMAWSREQHGQMSWKRSSVVYQQQYRSQMQVCGLSGISRVRQKESLKCLPLKLLL